MVSKTSPPTAYQLIQLTRKFTEFLASYRNPGTAITLFLIKIYANWVQGLNSRSCQTAIETNADAFQGIILEKALQDDLSESLFIIEKNITIKGKQDKIDLFASGSGEGTDLKGMRHELPSQRRADLIFKKNPFKKITENNPYWKPKP